MPLHEAWAVLGKNVNSIMVDVSRMPRSERAKALLDLVDEAKRLAKHLLAKHHPDRGGDEMEFHKVQNAIQSITHHTADFVDKIVELNKKIEESKARRSVFIDVEKPGP